MGPTNAAGIGEASGAGVEEPLEGHDTDADRVNEGRDTDRNDQVLGP